MAEDILVFVLIGFVAQLIDGAIGMAYGITAATALMSMGVPPAAASAAVHAAEVATTAASGTAHWRLGNVDRKLVVRLAVPGVLGGMAGAYLLVNLPSERLRPFVSAYLLAMGLLILIRALRHFDTGTFGGKHPAALGLAGGFLDAIGGGGWGAMVTSTLVGWGVTPRFAIGSANVAEFFVTVAVTAMFFVTTGLTQWTVIFGLVIGGVLAAPLAALAARSIPDRPMMMLVGGAVILLSVRNLLASPGP